MIVFEFLYKPSHKYVRKAETYVKAQGDTNIKKPTIKTKIHTSLRNSSSTRHVI
jgi:hypothetical protein